MRDELDRILDEGLASYLPEPRAGLQRRVLGRVAERPRRWWLWTAPALAVAAALLMFVSLPGEPPPPVAVTFALSAPPEVRPVVIKPRAVQPGPPYRPLLSGPPTREELALAKLAREHPEVLAQWSASIEKAAAPIVIEELKIEPLNSETM